MKILRIIRRVFTFVMLSIMLVACDKDRAHEYHEYQLRILAIGNSYSQDALAYVPFILQNIGVDVDIQIGILMQSSSTIANHVENFENSAAVYTYYHYDGGTSWSMKPLKSIRWALTHYQWDVIITHRSSRTQNEWDTSYNPFLNQLVTQIHSVIDYPVKFAWMISPSRPAETNGGVNRTESTILSNYGYTASDSYRVIEESPFEVVIPVGTAIQNARTIPTLKAMGEYADNPNNSSGLGYLCAFDGVHLQEGLPCQIAAYSCVLSFLDMLGLDSQIIFNDNSRITAAWAAKKSIPSPHGAYIGSNEENRKLAQMCAFMANQNPYAVTDILSLTR